METSGREHSLPGSPGAELVVTELGMVWPKLRPARRPPQALRQQDVQIQTHLQGATLQHGSYMGAFSAIASLHS